MDLQRHPATLLRVAQRRPIIAVAAGLTLVLGVALAVAAAASCACGAARPAARAAGAGRRPGAVTASVPVAVGAPGPAVACTQTLDVGGSLEDALHVAPPGSVICLNGGRWSGPQLSGVAPPGNVTVAAAPGQTVYMAGLALIGPGAVGNLTFRGIHFTSGVRGVGPITGGLVFKYDTFHNIPNTYAFYFYGNGHGDRAAQTGVSILYTQIDHVGQCLELVGDAEKESHFVFAHNVCGPGIGYGEDRSFGAHYIQSSGVKSLTVDNNAFEGPPDPNTARFGDHLNVLHVWGSSRAIDFSNNIIWHVQAIGQMILLGDHSYPSLLDNVTLGNNLDVSDPACGPQSSCRSYSMYSLPVHTLTWTHNTIIGSVFGVGLGWRAGCTATCYSASTNTTGAFNIAASGCGLNRECNRDYSALACEAVGCVAGHNVSTDASANSALGGTDNVVGWIPRFVTTSWTPQSGSPWTPPPPGYYQPVGLPFAAGYQEPIGP